MPNPEPGPERDAGPSSFVPKPRFDYKAPSLLWEHRYLAIFFVAALLIATLLLFRAPHKQLTIEPPPVYVEPIPEHPASSAQ